MKLRVKLSIARVEKERLNIQFVADREQAVELMSLVERFKI